MPIVDRKAIIAKYKSLYDMYPNDAKRIAAISKQLGIDADSVTETLLHIEELECAA